MQARFVLGKPLVLADVGLGGTEVRQGTKGGCDLRAGGGGQAFEENEQGYSSQRHV